MEFVSVKCPECGATLNIEEGRSQVFCTYCGTKVMLHNENEHIYRNIDEAEIKKAETDRMIKMQQLQMEEKENERHRQLVIVWAIATGVLLALGIIGVSVGVTGLAICIFLAFMVGTYGGLALFDKKKKRKRVVGADEVVITSAMSLHRDKNYNSIYVLFRSAGFQNVAVVPLKDLNILTLAKNGKVDDVTIDGDNDFDEGDVFPKTAHVLITYHSM